MEIVIWGTGVRGKRAKKLCDKTGRKVRAFTDNEPSHWGREIENIPIVSPEELAEKHSEKIQIWIATGAAEVLGQAKEICENVIEWELVKCMLLAIGYPYPKVQLKYNNIARCQLVENREEFLKRFSHEANNWKMAEIGVFNGDFSEQILKMCNPQKLYLIDLWGSGYEEKYLKVKEKFVNESESGTVEILRGLSTERLKEFDDGELDWVYIDTVHDYETTKMELELCDKKIVKGGYLCGHDYTKHDVYCRTDYGVYDAVNEFAVSYNYEFVYLTAEWHGLQSFALKRIGE